MSKGITENYKHKVFYNISQIRVKSKRKPQKAIDWYIDLLKRQQTQWDTNRLVKTMPKAKARLKKYWITAQMVQKKIEHKWLTLFIMNQWD